MKKSQLVALAAIVFVILIIGAVSARVRQHSRLQKPFEYDRQGSAGTQPQVPEPNTVTNKPETQTKQWTVKNIKEISGNGSKDMDWDGPTNLIAYGKMNPQTYYYALHTMKPDGSADQCLSCGRNDVPQKHIGNPTWQPGGAYIIFTAERADTPKQYDNSAIPGSGLYNDLWAVSGDNMHYYPLTNYDGITPTRAVIHPQFSHDGKKVVWGERVSTGSAFGGGWVLKLADFDTSSGIPKLINIQSFSPASCSKSCLYEPHGFSPDDSKIIFSANTDAQNTFGGDLYTYDLNSHQLTNMTNTPSDWDEHGHFSPDGTKIAWMSSTGFNIDWTGVKTGQQFDYLKTELWIMDSDGTNKNQLTHFNTPGASEYLGQTIVSDSAWGPDGKSLAVLTAYKTSGNKTSSKIFIVTLQP